MLERAAVPLAHSCAAVSELTARRLKELGGFKLPITVTPNGVNTHDIADIPAEGPSSDIIYVGRLLAHKRLDLLLEAVAELRGRHPTLSCLIVGSGPERERLRSLTATLMLEDHVTFTGEIPEENVYGFLKRSKVFVLPSLREGFGMSVLEALACSVPAVVVRAPYSAAHEIVADGVNGRVAEPSPRSLAEAISSLLEDPAKRGLMAEAAQQAASQYDWAVIAQKSLGIYEAARRC